MKFDIEIPTCREGVFVPEHFAGPAAIAKTVVEAERLGYYAVWATDFLAPTPQYGIPADVTPNWYEALISLAYCAALTKTIMLGTGVLMAPFRDPIILAKQAATLDCFSNGRFLLGLGLGMCRDEYEAVHPRDTKARRGTLLDECIEVMRLVCAEHAGTVEYTGECYEFKAIRLDPKPVQKLLPIYVPGRTPEALERALKFDLGIMIGAAQAKERFDALRAVAEASGRDAAAVDVIAEGELRLASNRDTAIAAYTSSQQGKFRIGVRGAKLEAILATQWIGTPAEVIAKMNVAVRNGVRHFNVLHIAGDTMSERLEQMQMFSELVMPHVAA